MVFEDRACDQVVVLRLLSLSMTSIMEASACTLCGEARMHARACKTKKKKKPWGSRWVQVGVVPLTPLLPASKARLEKEKEKIRPANADLGMKASMQGQFTLQ